MKSTILFCKTAFALFYSLAFFSAGNATNYTVTSVSEFDSKMSVLQAGDTIFLKNQTWNNAVLTFDPPNAGTGTKNIVLAAQTPGKAVMSGSSRLIIKGKYLTVTGLRFMNGGGIGTSPVISFGDHNTSYCRVTNTSIESYNSTSDNKWVVFYGNHNRLDHSYLFDKSNEGSTVLVIYTDNLNSTYHRIDNNYLKERTMPGTNNGEGIRVGDSGHMGAKGFNIIEYNLIERHLKEPEAITSKSCDNIYRYNTFRNNDGGLTLRHGDRALVEGNYFFGKTGRGYSRGIRVMGDGNVVINNYLEELEGATQSANKCPIVVITGDANTLYAPVKDAIIAFNTIVNCAGPSIRVGVVESGSTDPSNLTIANNLVFGNKNSTNAPIAEDNAPTSKKYEGNLYYGVGSTSLSGWTKSTSSLLALNGSTYRPGPASPAVDAAKGTYSTLNTYTISMDMDGGTHSGTWDVGSDEYNVTGGVKQPLTNNDVGPCWMWVSGCKSVTTGANNPVSAEEIRDVRIYPNPGNGTFTLDMTRFFSTVTKIEILDITGRQVLQLEEPGNALQQVTIPGSKNGCYILRIETTDGVMIAKRVMVL